MRKRQTHEQSPAFQFYANDWISEPNRMRMTLEEQGAYILLYCHCWRGFRIPFDYEVMARMCNCTIEKVKKMWPSMQDMFEQVKDKNGGMYLICLQAEEERKEQAENRKKRQAAGRKGAEKRWGKDEVQSK